MLMDLEHFYPLLIVTLSAVVVLGLAHYLLLARHSDLGSEAKLPRQLLLLALTLAAIVVLIMAAPLAESTRNQVLSLLGIVISAVIAFASTSFVTNFMAAVMLRVTRPFKVGDFITVNQYFGKVTERGLFDTEIQTENRELIAIPNATFINQPVTVARSSGVIISTNISLGYDVSHARLEPLMIKAADDAGLTDPFVLVTQLGDFSISYRVCGLLKDVDGILTARSRLNRCLLDTLHSERIEVVSPTVTRHITHAADHLILPEDDVRPVTSAVENSVTAEEIVFDKARDIAALEEQREHLKVRLETGENLSKEATAQLQEQLVALDQRLKVMREAE